jgi:hypothetical protein
LLQHLLVLGVLLAFYAKSCCSAFIASLSVAIMGFIFVVFRLHQERFAPFHLSEKRQTNQWISEAQRVFTVTTLRNYISRLLEWATSSRVTRRYREKRPRSQFPPPILYTLPAVSWLGEDSLVPTRAGRNLRNLSRHRRPR